MRKLPVRYENPREHSCFAKNLRKQSSKPEQLLWNALRVLRKTTGIKFRRQHPLHPYIADFACVEYRLIVEIDGYSHDARQTYDKEREMELRYRGWTVIRFNNDEVCANLEGVVMEIIKQTKQLSGRNLNILALP